MFVRAISRTAVITITVVTVIVFISFSGFSSAKDPVLKIASPDHASFLQSPLWTSENLQPSKQQRFEYLPLTFMGDQTWYESPFFQGGDWSKIGRTWLHPGTNAPAVLTFAAPHDGTVTITSQPKKLHLDAGTDGVRLFVLHNDQQLWTCELDGADSVGKPCNFDRIVVRKGDSIRFIVHQRGQIACDTTGWDPIISYLNSDSTKGDSKEGAPAETYQASEYFPNKDNTLNKPNSPFQYTMQLNPDSGNRITPPAVPASLVKTMIAALSRSLDDGMAVSDDVRLWKLVLAEWVRDAKLKDMKLEYGQSSNGQSSNGQSLNIYRETLLQNAAVHLVNARQLYRQFRPTLSPAWQESLDRRFAVLESAVSTTGQIFITPANTETVAGDTLRTWLEVRILKRQVIILNPLMKSFDELIFVKRKPSSYSHITMQFNGWRAQKGGGLFVLKNPGTSVETTDLLAGHKLEGTTADEGSILEPALSYDGKTIAFSWVKCTDRPRFPWQAYYPDKTNEEESVHDEYFHLFTIGADGSNLRQLTDATYDDLFPCWLPDGDMAFMSTRRRGYARCFWWGFGNRWHVYTLHRMHTDGSNIQTLSWHDTNEWFPSIGHDGQIYYARWDYIDRDAVTHQNLWSSRPDGTNPTAVWGNGTPSPHATFHARPIPDSRKWLCVAAAHHSIAAGSLFLLDPSVGHDGHEPIERITPEIPFPESETRNITQYYDTPWPLSEDFYLVSYSPVTLEFEPKHQPDNALGLYILDRWGNRELLYRDEDLGCCSPIPLAATLRPPVLPSQLPENPQPTGRMFVTDVYQGLGTDIERGQIKQLRIVQIFPKDTRDSNTPPIGLGGEENGRAILGTVPVESDGSANFTVPAQTPFYFQALDAKGQAFQTMRSLTYVQPGEEIGCIGCHEGRKNTGSSGPYFDLSKTAQLPIAAKRAASTIDPGLFGGRPFSYPEIIQPILDRKCISCHGAKPDDEAFLKHGTDLTGVYTRSNTDSTTEIYSRSYRTLMKSEAMVPRAKMRNQIQVSQPGGQIGSLGSGLMKMLDDGHENVSLTPEERAAMVTWIDMNAIFYGVTAPDQQEIIRTGKPVKMQSLK